MKISKKSQGNLLKILRGNLVVFPEQFKILAKAFNYTGGNALTFKHFRLKNKPVLPLHGECSNKKNNVHCKQKTI